VTRNDRTKSGFRLEGRTDAEIEAMAKMSLAELSATVLFPTTSIPSRWPSARQNAARGAQRRGARISGGKTDSAVMVMVRAWAKPQGHADIAPSRFERLERDGYFTIDSDWIIPALCRAVRVEGPILEP
jgi:hypothetical protein